MRMSWPFGRHRRWLAEVDAFVDGELVGDRARRFEAHVARCHECAALVANSREVKHLTMALPAVRAPRSFQVTPGMLVEAQPASVRRGAPVIARLAQLTAGVAALAFVAVLVADLSSGDGSGGSQQQATSSDDAAGGAAPEAADRDLRNSSPAATGQADAASESPTIPDVGPSVGAAGNPGATPSPSSTSSNSFGAQTPAAPAGDTAKGAADALASPPEALGETADITKDDDDDGENGRALLLAEIALAAAASLGTVAWLTLRRRGAQT